MAKKSKIPGEDEIKEVCDGEVIEAGEVFTEGFFGGEGTELDTLRAELLTQKEQNLRVLAEYDNYRKRTAKEREQLYSTAAADTVEKLLPVYDNLARACGDKDCGEGVKMIFRQTEEIFEKIGVAAFGEAGDTFDPDLYEAVFHEENPDFGDNQVTEVLAKGFKYKDKVIRHAVVKTAN